MKSSISLLSLSFLLIFSYKAIAQGEAAIPFLYQNPSPQFSGLGWTGVSLPNDDAFGFYYNPAQLGYFGKTIICHFKPIRVQLIGLILIKLICTAQHLTSDIISRMNSVDLI